MIIFLIMKRPKIDLKKFMVYFIAFIMISSAFAVIFYGFADQTTSLKYEGITFTKSNIGWDSKIDGKRYSFYYHPSEVEFINVSDRVLEKIASYQLDMTSDSESEFKDTIALVEYDLSTLLNSNYNVFSRTGFINENEFYLPIFNCSMATEDIPVIYFTFSNATSVSLKDNCIVVEARNDPDFLRIKDRLVYGLLSVIS